MTEIQIAIREIEQMDLQIENYFRRDRDGENPTRPDYKGFIDKMRAQWSPSLDSNMPSQRSTASSILDKLLTYERIWDGQFIRYAEERKNERKRQAFLDKALRVVDQISTRTGTTYEASIIDTFASQYDEVVQSGREPCVYYNKTTRSFSVKAKE